MRAFRDARARFLAGEMRTGIVRNDRWKWHLALFVVFSPLANQATAQTGTETKPRSSAVEPDNPHILKPHTKTVAVFKNGMGFFTREAKATLTDGWCYAAELPPAAFGTLAVYSTSPNESVDVVGAGIGESIDFDDTDAPSTLEAKLDKLRKIKGMLVEIKHRHQYKNEILTVSGKLSSFSTEYAVIEEASQTFAVPVQEIRSIRVRDLPLRVHVVDGKAKPVEKANIGIAYLRKGITWIPEYTLRILDEETAELTLRGTLVNEAEDLVHCDVNFVVGVPHFVHSDLLSPAAVGRAIRMIGSSLPAGSVPSQVMSQVMNRAAFANNALASGQFDNLNPGSSSEGDLQSMLNSLPSLDNAAAGDFTVYTKSDLTVRQGERAIVTLFTQKVRYSHRYRWDMPNPIKHELLLRNDSKTPWTTGPCLAISGDNPLSEDLLKYTPVGGLGAFEVTSAINVAHTVLEEEIDRKMKAHDAGVNHFLDMVTLRGTIKLKSFAKNKTELTVKAPVNGKPTKFDPTAKAQMNSEKLRLVEISSTLQWQLTLEPGEEKTLEYEYNRFVPSN